jgi:distribution and morphology protein 31
MSSSTARSTLFGRHAWRSLYESLDSFTSRLSPRQSPANRIGLNQSHSYSSTSYTRPSKSSPWTFPRSPRPHGYSVRRSFTSGGLLLASLSPNSSTTSTVVTTCSAAADSAIAGNITQKANLSKLARQAWQRGVHTGRGRNTNYNRRRKSTKSSTDASKAAASQPKPDPSKPGAPGKPGVKPTGEDQQGYIANYFHLPNVHLPHLPHLPHRPTKEEFLAAANGFWERMKVRFKWFSIRSMRPWNTDEWGAFLSFFLFGHLVWILVGTTTFVSFLLFSINTVFAQGRSTWKNGIRLISANVL